MVEQKQEVDFRLLGQDAVLEKPLHDEEGQEVENAARHFISHLVALVETSLGSTQRDTLHGARTTPMHGMLLCSHHS